MELSGKDYNNLIFIVLLTPFLAGVVMGFMGKLVVFQDYDDLGLTFLMFILPIPMIYIYCLLGKSQLMLYFFLAIEILIMCFILYKSFINNRKNIFYTLLALYAKIPLSFIYLFNLLLIIDDFFDKRINRKTKISAILFAVLTPMMAKLVKNKTGVFR